jgi:hypothetical protein
VVIRVRLKYWVTGAGVAGSAAVRGRSKERVEMTDITVAIVRFPHSEMSKSSLRYI